MGCALAPGRPCMNLRIGLTGGRGALGRVLQAAWPGVDWRIFSGDVRDFDSVVQWIDGSEGIDAVLHLAAVVPTARVEGDPLVAFETNAGGTLHVMEALRRKANRPWVFLASTSHVYPASDRPLDETTPPAPSSLYGATKLEAEGIALAFARWYELPVCVGRIFSYTAPGQHESFLVPGLRKRIAAAAKGATLELRGARQVRDFVPAHSIASAVALLSEKRAEGIYNIGSGSGISIIDLARLIATSMGRTDVNFAAASTESGGLVADIHRLLDLGWEGSGSINEAIGG